MRSSVSIAMIWCSGLLCLMMAGLAPANTLQITRAQDSIQLSWAAAASTYAPEYTETLGSNQWFAVTNPPVLSGGVKTVLLTGVTNARFFRLRASAPTAPTLSNVAAPATLVLGGTGALSFDYLDPDCDVVSLLIIRSNILGVVTNGTPASMLNLTTTGGHVSVPLYDGQLAFGTNSFTIQLLDRFGLVSASTRVSVVLGGQAGGGSAPQIISFAPVTQQWTRPSGVRDRLRPKFVLRFNDADGDIARVRVRIRAPSGPATVVEHVADGFGISGPTGFTTNALLMVRQTSPLGTYFFEVTLIDGAGRFSATVTNSFSLLGSGGAAPVSIASFSPGSGPAGTEVTVIGTGFDTSIPASNRVIVSTVEVEPTEVTSTSLKFILPEVRGSGRISVENQNGASSSAGLFVVPLQVRVVPDSATVELGKSLQFDTRIIGSASQLVTWMVNGVSGGDTNAGTISASGLYRAPGIMPAGGVMVVTAALTRSPTNFGQARVEITPPIPLPGAGRILAGIGGTVRSVDGSATIGIPTNALATDQTITISVLRGTNQPPPSIGRITVGAVRLGPSGVNFATPAQVAVPLSRAFPPGTLIRARYYHPDSGTYQDEGLSATVLANGDRALASITHFSDLVLDAQDTLIDASAPTVTSVTPNSGLEGARVPVLLTGTHLSSDIQVDVQNMDGSATEDIAVETFLGEGASAGVLLHIQTIGDLGAAAGVSETRQYKLVLRKPNNTAAETLFTVKGLNELIVGPGEIRDIERSNMFSQVTIAGPTFQSPNTQRGVLRALRPAVSGENLQIESTGPVLINGVVDAAGLPGGDAFENHGGTAPADGEGGRGGNGRDRDVICMPSMDGGPCAIDPQSAACLQLPIGFPCPAPDAYGANGNRTGTNQFNHPFGFGGYPGKNISIIDDIISAIVDAISCVRSVASGDVLGLRACGELVDDIIEIADDVDDIEDGKPSGRKGYAADVGPDAGGGGGGGGGTDGHLGGHTNGGGGGAGGSGGRAVRILTLDTLVVNGLVDSSGGRGGTGAVVHIPRYDMAAAFRDGALFANPNTLSNYITGFDSGYPGGGGGGGAAGRIQLGATLGVYPPNPAVDRVNSFGGRGGLGGLIETERDGIKAHFVMRSSIAQDGPNARSDIYNPIFEVDALRPMVTEHRLLRLRSVASYAGNLPQFIPEIDLRDETGDLPAIHPAMDAGGHLVATLLLRPGFNTFRQLTREFLNVTVLVVGSDTDGDGLSDADEADLGTNPNNADSDGDGLNDGDEILLGTNPSDPDTDADGLYDGAEVHLAGTSPLIPDSDGDGYLDSMEYFLHTNPAAAGSRPTNIPGDVLYADSTAPSGPDSLTLIDTGTGALGLVSQPNAGARFSFAFDNVPNLYFAQGTNLLIHDPIRLTNVFAAPLHLASGAGLYVAELAYNPTNDFFYGQERGAPPASPATGQLVQFDPIDGTATRIGPPGEIIKAMAFTATGELLAVMNGNANSDRLVKLNPASGAIAQEAGFIGYPNITGLAVTTNGTIVASQVIGLRDSRLLALSPVTGLGSELTHVARQVYSISAPTVRGRSALVSINYARLAAGTGPSFSGPLAGSSYESHVSDNGRFIVFTSAATNLTALPDLNNASDVFVRDLETLTTEIASANAAGDASARSAVNGNSILVGSRGFGTISSDGRIVAFVSSDTNLVAGQAPPAFLRPFKVYRRLLSSGITEEVSPTLNGVTELDTGILLTMSGDGAVIAYEDFADSRSIFVRNMSQPAPELLVTNAVLITVSPGGRYVLFYSATAGLTPIADANGVNDLFVKDLQTGDISMVSVNRIGTAAGNGASGDAGLIGNDSYAVFSSNDRYVVFTSRASDLVNNPDTNNSYDAFVRDLQSGTTTLVSMNTNGGASGIMSPGTPKISGDGTRVVFLSDASNLVAGVVDTNNLAEAYVRDIPAATTKLVSTLGTNTALGAFSAAINGDGQRIAFRNQTAVYLRDVPSSATTLLTADFRNRSVPGMGGGYLSVSSDGTVVSFTSAATNLVRLPDLNGTTDVFVRQVPR